MTGHHAESMLNDHFHSTFSVQNFSINGYGAVGQEDSVIVIGGFCDGERTKEVQRFTLTPSEQYNGWKYLGTLQNSRGFSRGIINDGQLFIIGGRYSL